MRRAILVVTVIIAAVLVGTSAVAYAKEADKKSGTTLPETTSSETTGPITIENHSWGDYHWARTANPFTLNLGDNVTSTWDPYLTTSSSETDWSQSTVLDTTVVPGTSSAKRCPAKDGRVEVCNSTYGKNGWLGIASIWGKGSHITKGTTKLNDSYFKTTKYNTPAWRSLVMCQEVGHTFGLGHQDENFSNENLNTCMDYTNLPDSNQHPNQGDYDELLCIYDPATKGQTLNYTVEDKLLHTCTGTGHTDDTSTVGSTSGTSTGDKEPGDGPAAWGKEKFRSADGRLSVFEKDLGKDKSGNDNKKITHVFWTEEKAKEHGGKIE